MFQKPGRGAPCGSFPKLGVPFLAVPIIRIVVFLGLCWGPLTLGNYHAQGNKNQDMPRCCILRQVINACDRAKLWQQALAGLSAATAQLRPDVTRTH